MDSQPDSEIATESLPDSRPKTCPACGGLDTGSVVHQFSSEDAAEHFVPRSRFPVRHAKLVELLDGIWPEESVEVRRCQTCRFTFPVPYVSGSAEFYNLVSGESPHYPRRRWEFHRTIRVLVELYSQRTPSPGALLEAGAGDGSFLKAVRRAPLRARPDLLATEFDKGALRRLRRAGFEPFEGSLIDLAADPSMHAHFDVICVFQVLEHMAYPEKVFRACVKLGRPGAHIFASVPNGEAIDEQEQLIQYWDMPPNHVGRWYPDSVRRFAARLGLRLVELEMEPTSRMGRAWHLAKNATRSAAYRQGSLENRVNSIRFRPARGLLRMALAIAATPRMKAAVSERSSSQWIHLQAP